MEPINDPQLSKLLREWRVDAAPPSLDARVLALREPWWRFLLTGSIRIPVPVGVAIVAILLAMVAVLVRRPAPRRVDAPVNLVDFRPVDDPKIRVIRR
jgi:hypothetical protein